MMKPRSAFVFGGFALALGLLTLGGVAQANGTTVQDPSPKELRDRVINVLTQMQEQNTFQRNIGLFWESIYTPRDGQGRVNTGTSYYQLPGKSRKHYDLGDRVVTHVDDKRSMFTRSTHYATDARIDPVMSSLLDIMAIEPSEWIRRARSLGIDPDKFNEQEWNGKQYIVIGGDPDQLNVPQVWIEKETLRPARAIMFQVRGSDRIFDYQLLEYQAFEDGSIFPGGYEMYEGRYRIERAEWSRFEVNRETNDDFFDTEKIEEELKQGGAAAGVADGGGGGDGG